MPHFCRVLSIALLCLLAIDLASAQESALEQIESKPLADPDEKSAQLILEVVNPIGGGRTKIVPARIILTASDGKFIDGSGRGTYQDGRFFAEGDVVVSLPAGKTRVQVQRGPEYRPVDATIELKGGQSVRCRATLSRWFDAAKLGWYCGDNHVHTQHDATVAIRTDPAYTALQARANGLNFITEADHELKRDELAKHDTPSFLYRQAPEVRPGPFVGHLNTPGIKQPVDRDKYQAIVAQPLPALSIHREVRELGGVMIRTHPMSPPYQLHWMGAAELWSDAVLGEAADLVDIDSPATELLYFATLNLGNKLGVSSYTDCALGRKQTMSPGDRRVYAKADRFDYDSIVAAMRAGRTIATNGGPLLTFLTVDGREVGESIDVKPEQVLKIRCEVHTLRPLRSVELYHRGGRLHAFKRPESAGSLTFEHEMKVSGAGNEWIVLRADDEKNAWSITSPVYLRGSAAAAAHADALLVEISNHTRFIQLRKQFFGHLIATVRPPESITSVRWLRDGQAEKTWTPADGDQRQDSRAPVTDIRGDYGPGWQWHRVGKDAVHFQADWTVTQTGRYALEVRTSADRTLRSDAIRFNSEDAVSHAISFARLTGADVSLTLHGYGEEQALRDIRSPFVGDGWWYPRNTAWRLRARFGTWTKQVGAGESRLDDRVQEAAGRSAD